MSIPVYQTFVISRIIFFTSFTALLVVNIAFAQSDIDVTTSSTASSTEALAEIPIAPYETENLLGNEVFGDFVVGPGKIELTIQPGESKVVMVTVSNRTGSPHIFEINSEDVQGSTDPAQTLVLLGDDRGPYSMKDYVSVTAPRFELGHSQRARIPVTVSIPADAEPGGLYGSLLVSTVTTEARAGDSDGTAPQSAIVARIGTLFFITIPGQFEKNGSLKEFNTVPPKSVYQNGPLTFGLLFENDSPVHLAPYGEIRIRNFFDEEVGYMQLEPWFVLPKALRLREVTWNRDLLFGRYTATAYINRSYDDIVDEKSFVFWVLPWKPLLGAFATLFFVFFIFRAFFRRFEFKRKT